MPTTLELVHQGYKITTTPVQRKPPDLPTLPQLRALTALARHGVPRDLHPATRRILLQRGWAREHEGTVLLITDTGQAALMALHPHIPLYLARASGYTTTVDRLDAGEVIDPGALDRWIEEAELCRLEAQELGRKYKKQRARAFARNVSRQALAA